MGMAEGWNAVATIAERKIQEAIEEGQLDNLPGYGKPLELEDLSHIPPDMRMAYTLLKNSGFYEQKKEDFRLPPITHSLLAQEDEPDEERMRRLRFRLYKLQEHRKKRF